MRLSLLAVLAFTVVLGVFSNAPKAPLQAQALSASVASVSSVADAQEPGAKLNVDINVNKGGGGRWYANPVWIAIGGLAVLVLIALIIMAARGGGTTVVKG
jgi:hypothetical protein